MTACQISVKTGPIGLKIGMVVAMVMPTQGSPTTLLKPVHPLEMADSPFQNCSKTLELGVCIPKMRVDT